MAAHDQAALDLTLETEIKEENRARSISLEREIEAVEVGEGDKEANAGDKIANSQGDDGLTLGQIRELAKKIQPSQVHTARRRRRDVEAVHEAEVSTGEILAGTGRNAEIVAEAPEAEFPDVQGVSDL